MLFNPLRHNNELLQLSLNSELNGTMHLAHRLYLFISYGSQKKQEVLF